MNRDLYQEAIERFVALYATAQSSGLVEPTSVTLATAGADGRVSARTVLLKEVDVAGFVFYTNRRSRKGRQLGENPHAAMCFFWQPLWEQVLVEGRVQDVSDAEADAYWATRPRLSQIAAWASEQSEPLVAREELERRVAEMEERFGEGPVPRPPHWSGYRLVPDMIEFWSSRPGRLHERVCYRFDGDMWQRYLVNP